MTYKDVLVHLDDSKGCGKRIDAAVRLAKQHDAHLTGVYPIVEIPLLHYTRRHIPRHVQASMDAEAQRQAEAALERFRMAGERSGVAYETRVG
jgi:nucleotide-binding universal stress UspA family protein